MAKLDLSHRSWFAAPATLHEDGNQSRSTAHLTCDGAELAVYAELVGRPSPPTAEARGPFPAGVGFFDLAGFSNAEVVKDGVLRGVEVEYVLDISLTSRRT